MRNLNNVNLWLDFAPQEVHATCERLMSEVAAMRDTQTVYPAQDDILNALAYTAPGNVRAVILGQDPYHEPGQANGLSFSVHPGVAIPPSLVNIYQELHDDIGCRIPNNGDLTKWARQGVLMLNTVLTVRAHHAFSHRGLGWEQFTDAAITAVNGQARPIVFILWGKAAQAKCTMLDNPEHLVLKSPHPSPLSAYHGFFGSKPFSQTNRFLKAHGVTPIDWQIEDV